MEVSSNEDQEIPMPINTSYGGAHGHLIHHHHHHHNNDHHPLNPPPPPAAATIPPLSTAPPITITIPPPTMTNNNGNSTTTALSIVVDDQQQQQQKKKRSSNSNVRYRECLKNHAASMGGTATDGCGEFMPSGEDGSIEALTCSACNCHRNFHRKEIQVDFPTLLPHLHPGRIITKTNNLNHHHHHEKQLLLGHPHHQMVMSYNMAAAAAAGSLSQSDDHEGVQELEEPHQDDGNNKMMMMGGGNSGAATGHHHHHRHYNNNNYNNNSQGMGKKRFRTKFSVEQKEKMLEFAESVGWKIQKQEESVVQRFCQEIGVKRRVLKVWMHNNKHSHASPKHTAGGAAGDHHTVVAPVINTSVLHPPSTAT